jgi:oxygen-independent coproporphyrinogen-3 oxidase
MTCEAKSSLHAGEPLEGNYFVAAYPPFSCWDKAMVDEYRRAIESRPDPTTESLGVYVHIPFCGKRCQFCYYLSYAGKTRAEIDEYVDALIHEMKLYREKTAINGRGVDFVYVGGGTPSLLPAEQIRRLMSALRTHFDLEHVREITFECAPKTVTETKLDALRAGGVTRVSLGIQQLNDEVLRKNGRIHLVPDVERAFTAIRKTGFEVVNVDLMVGLVGESDETFFTSLEQVIQMAPDCVTIYQLEIPHNTPLYKALGHESPEGIPASWAVKRMRLGRAFHRLEEAGYSLQSAYMAALDRVRHRFVYQEEQYHGSDLLGLGVSSFSILTGVHHQNLDQFGTYLARLRGGNLPFGRAYTLSGQEQFVREFILQLKLGAVDLDALRRKFGKDFPEPFGESLRHYASEGWLAYDNRNVTLTREGLLRVDRLLPGFYLPQHRGVRYA